MAIATHGRTIFFARLGDQDRFADPAPGRRSVMSYARNVDALARYLTTTGSKVYHPDNIAI